LSAETTAVCMYIYANIFALSILIVVIFLLMCNDEVTILETDSIVQFCFLTCCVFNNKCCYRLCHWLYR